MKKECKCTLFLKIIEDFMGYFSVFPYSTMTIVRKVHSQEMRDIFQKHREDGKSVAWISNALQIAT
jgi:hypothetical protein